MIDYGTIEDEIVARLQQVGLPATVQPLPDVQSDFLRPVGNNGVISVCYAKSEYLNFSRDSGKMLTINKPVAQDEVAVFEVVIRHTKLRTQGGMYDLIRSVKLALIGFTPSNISGGMYLYGTAFNRFVQESQTWAYSVQFAAHTLLVEDAEYVDPTLPKLQKVSAFVYPNQLPGVIGLPNGSGLVLPGNSLIIPN